MTAFQLKNEVLTIIILAGITIFSLPSCTHEPAGIEDMEAICFDSQVLPLLQTSCGTSGCHGSGSIEGGFDVSNYQAVMKAVSPGDPRGSELYHVLTAINSETMMPPDGPLTREQRTTIEVWIAQGAENTRCEGGENNEVCFVQDILPMMLSSCGITGCHDATTHEEGYVLTDYNSIMAKGIQPYDPNDSEIFDVVTETGDDRMPPSPRNPLTPDQVAALRQWILDGAQNSDCPDNACDTTGTISFSAQVNPVLQTNCVGCHNSTLASGGVNLSSYAHVATHANTLRNGTSLLIGAITRQAGFQPMPPSFSLNACDIRTIELWIGQGAAEN